jgi:hypothetical protein
MRFYRVRQIAPVSCRKKKDETGAVLLPGACLDSDRIGEGKREVKATKVIIA